MKAAGVDIKNIDIALDSYEDIFSDFDISPYTKRTLSEDFISELIKRVGVDHLQWPVDVYISIPKKNRNQDDEKIIIRRIKHYFSKMHIQVERDIQTYQERGIRYLLAGIFLVAVVFVMQEYYTVPVLLREVLTVASWFSIWSGISKIIDEPYHLNSKKKLYKTLSSANYIFVSEESITGMEHAPEVLPPNPLVRYEHEKPSN
ncbi:MAG: hypothetical protein ACPL0A_00565 [Candidatus Micrarchaeia archaeon]